MASKIACIVLMLVVLQIAGIHGHGRLNNPPGRSTRWRYDSSAPPNYDDHGLYCGGYNVHYNTYGGKCGLCGDSYGDPRPRANELGGKYGQGVIVRTYNGNRARVGFELTQNHLGYVHFNLCNLDQYGSESEDCFNRHHLRFADGNDKYYVGSRTGYIETDIVFPGGLNCRHCVLRWTYTAGNNWGYCQDGTGALGCGPQETFKACADISVYGARNIETPEIVEMPVEVPVAVPLEEIEPVEQHEEMEAVL